VADSAVEVARWAKPGGDQVVLRRNDFNGQTYLDLRVFTPDTTAGPGVPTKAGLCLSPGKWRELLPTLTDEAGGAGEDE